MVEEYGRLEFFGDIQTPATKASSSDIYPAGAWDLGITGSGVNIALTDTGVDSEHPGLLGKHVAGYDAVCFVHSDPMCILAGGRQTDGSFDPDDGNQHGTACMGMAAATGIGPDGEQTVLRISAQRDTHRRQDWNRRRCRPIRELPLGAGVLRVSNEWPSMDN